MKAIWTSLVFGVIVGGLAFFTLQMGMERPVELVHERPVVSQVHYADGPMEGFAVAAERAMPAVVHIRAEESEELARRRRAEEQRAHPFYDFFNFRSDPFGRGFFGQPFYRKQGSGSGVILSNDGYIVTNHHVVGFADKIRVTLHDDRQFNAGIIGRDPSTDLAVIKIEASELPVISLVDSDRARVGDWVLAVGNPFDYLTSTVTAGIISAKGRNINIIEGEKTIEEFIQTDAVINPGNSGGALVDDQGRLLGINSAIATPTGVYAGYSFAIPSNLMRRIVNEIITVGGDIERVNLGIQVAELDEEYASELGLKFTEGVVIVDLDRGSPAQYAGLLPNDVLLAIDDQPVREFADLERALKFAKTGDRIRVKVLRGGKTLWVDVVL